MLPLFRPHSCLLISALLASVAFSHAEEVPRPAPQAYTLSDLQALAREHSQSLQAIRDEVDMARAGVRTARTFPNPEIEVLGGPAKARAGNPVTGNTRTASLVQPLDLPNRRWARVDNAEAQLASSEALGQRKSASLIAELQRRYYDLLRKEAELKASREDASLIEAIRSRIAKRVEVGESPRFELIKADTETLNARKAELSANVRVMQARAGVRQLIGKVLPPDFKASGRLDNIQEPEPLEMARENILLNNPEVRQARAELRKAESNLDYAQSLRWPNLALKASRTEDPELRTTQVGVVMTLPLWDWKGGPVAEARANLSRARHELSQAEFNLEQEIELAYQRLEMARAQVNALENGIVRQAEAALKVAEAAYRFGERGFIDVLDAQRVFRAARNELIAARYEFAVACSDIERLQASPETLP